MGQRLNKISIALGIFTISTLALGKFFDTRCTSSCIGEAFAENTERGLKNLQSLKDLQKYQIYFNGKDGKIDVHGGGGEPINISITEDDDDDDGDGHRVEGPATESFSSKDLKKILLSSRVTHWVITEGTTDKVVFHFEEYLPTKEWTVKESSGRLEVELGKRGPSEARLELPKDYAGNLVLATVSGDVAVEKLAKVDNLILTLVSGEIDLKAAPSKLLTLNTVSGDIDFHPATLSKDLEVNCNSVSADVRTTIKSPIKSISFKSVSGDVDLEVGKSVGFKFNMEGVSATFDGLPQKNINTVEVFAHRSANGSFGNDPKGELSFNSVSGDFRLRPAD